ncbi:hypothetical protein ACWDUB_23205 [Streptomyces fungicidicus]
MRDVGTCSTCSFESLRLAEAGAKGSAAARTLVSVSAGPGAAVLGGPVAGSVLR